MMSIDQYRQRIGLFHAKSRSIYPRKLKTDFSAVFLNLFIILIFSIAPLYIRLFHFFYQQMLPNLDSIIIKTINAIFTNFTKAPFIEPRLSASRGNPEVFLFLSIPFLPTCNDPLEITLLVLLLLIATPLVASWSVQVIRRSALIFKILASCLRKIDLLGIIIIYYNAQCDNLLLHGDIHANPGPPLSYMHWNVNSLTADQFAYHFCKRMLPFTAFT